MKLTGNLKIKWACRAAVKESHSDFEKVDILVQTALNFIDEQF